MKSELLRELVSIAEECVQEFHERVKDAKCYGDRDAAANFTQSIRGYNSTIREVRREIVKLEADGKKRSYTVLLLYPDYLSDNFGQETYLAHVKASSRKRAVQLAQREAQHAQGDDMNGSADFNDFHPLLVIEGHHEEAQN